MDAAPDPGTTRPAAHWCTRFVSLSAAVLVLAAGAVATGPATPRLVRTASSWSIAAHAAGPGSAPALASPTAPLPLTARLRPASAAISELGCSVVGGLRICSHGNDAALPGTAAAGEGGSGQTSTASTRIGCYGDGHSGPRIQAVYARPVTAADRLSAMLPSFRGWAGALEKAVDDSAHQTNGARHLRFATRPTSGGCTLDVLSVALPASAFASLTATISALQHQGLDSKGTKYLVWSDASGYCGIASMYDDATAGAGNLNNGAYPTYARIDRRCWGYAEAHEVVHMLGGVQKGAPHATAGFHCHDANDLMCYDDGTAGSQQVSTCASAQATLLDCHHDDYFSTAPARASWLATHWNVAGSAFLSPSWTDPAPAASPSPQPTPPADTAPAAGPGPSPSPQPLPPLAIPSLPPLGIAS